jgi:acetylornithine deacetylase
MTDATDPGLRRAILDAVRGAARGLCRMLERLVRCPSTLGNEQSALNEMARIYEAIGLAPRRVPTDPAALPRIRASRRR